VCRKTCKNNGNTFQNLNFDLHFLLENSVAAQKVRDTPAKIVPQKGVFDYSVLQKNACFHSGTPFLVKKRLLFSRDPLFFLRISPKK
jgi:hypothetical protein